ncbi:hypothetical protein [Aquiflexum lacus]|uniref:hypothetical protein n=1 Tax=Aquiflexum lacus TaxID=2483805 RepID=UPI0018936A9E|nr:hypothetical protein [Aquiflexum lacus]
MSIEDQKAIIIEKVKQVNDIDLINAIESMLEFASKKDVLIEIYDEHQKLVMNRFEKVRQDPERLLDLEEAQKILNEE